MNSKRHDLPELHRYGCTFAKQHTVLPVHPSGLQSKVSVELAGSESPACLRRAHRQASGEGASCCRSPPTVECAMHAAFEFPDSPRRTVQLRNELRRELGGAANSPQVLRRHELSQMMSAQNTPIMSRRSDLISEGLLSHTCSPVMKRKSDMGCDSYTNSPVGMRKLFGSPARSAAGSDSTFGSPAHGARAREATLDGEDETLEVEVTTQPDQSVISGWLKFRDNKRDENIIDDTAHTCTPDFAKNEIDEHLYRCKQELTTQNYPAVPQTYNAMVASYENRGLQLIAQIPSFKSVKSSLYRFRNKAAKLDKIQCDKINEVQVPPGYEDLLLADYYYNNTRIILFCSKTARKTLLEIEDYYSDGTFKVCPVPFDQLYTIHGDLGSTVNITNIVPLLYALMSDRQKSSYVALFSLIKSQVPGWNPRNYKTDYETAAMSAIATVFPSVTISGCYYHFNKAIWRKGREFEITKSKNPAKIREVALSAVLPLLPPSEVKNGWSYITRKETEDKNMKKFRAYMEKQWIKEEWIPTWNVYGNQHRTTNCLESWHNKLNREVGKKKPNLIHLLNIIRKDSSFYTVRTTMAKHNTKNLKGREEKSVLKDEFIQDVQMEFLNGSISVGHLLETLRH